jgi:hypothetical protein
MLLIKGLVILAAGFFLPPDNANDEGVSIVDGNSCIVRVSSDEDATPQTLKVMCLADGDQTSDVATSQVIVVGGADSDDENAPRIMNRVKIIGHGGPGAIEPGGPWLGVQFGPVPKPLAAQLELDDGVGQLILNVVEGSPADLAGFQQYDVIFNIDGETASAKMGEFLDIVGGFEPGETHTFSLIRGARSMDTVVTVGSRPEELGPSKYKYDFRLEELAEDSVQHRGGLLWKDEDGTFSIKGLDALHNLHVLPHSMRLGDEDFETLFESIDVLPGKGLDIMLNMKQENGESLQIKRDGDRITVTRTITNEDGTQNTTTRVYDSEEALEEDDPEAYKSIKHDMSCHFFYSGDGQDFQFGQDFKDLPKFFEDLDIDVDIEGILENARKTHEDAGVVQKDVAKLLRQHLDEQDAHQSLHDLFIHKKARTKFSVGSDGKIVVTTREGDEELVQTFDDADALKKARPDLYKKYKKLQKHSGELKGTR